ncbi:MAG: glucosamine-6-phosphate deaminase [Trueperaceae bacterium]
MSPSGPEVRKYDRLRVEIHASSESLAQAAATRAASLLADAIESRGTARVVLATGNSQLEFFRTLRQLDSGDWSVDWSKVEAFHMDEYLGIGEAHVASFRRFLRREVVEPLGLGEFHGIEGDPESAEETIERYSALLSAKSVDLCCMGIGENGHLAFNDPPGVDFDDPQLLRVVALDEVSRQQQVGEGHFPEISAVPTHAITLTIPALLSARHIIVIAPEDRKAEAVHKALEGAIDPSCPASILRTAGHANLYLDVASARLLERR